MDNMIRQDNARAPLSVIMPAYNEEGAIVEAVGEVREFILDRVPGAQITVVNDGSRDRTGALLDELAAQDDRVRVIHQPNGGHAAALMAGMAGTDSDFIMLLDSDRQIALDDFTQHWKLVQDGYDCVFGVRRTRHDPRLRLWLTRFIRQVLQLLFGVELYDANVPYKLLRRDVWDDASRLIPADTLAPSLFLAIYAKKRGYRVHEADILHRERETGEVSIRRFKLLRFCARGFMQMLAFRKQLRHVR